MFAKLRDIFKKKSLVHASDIHFTIAQKNDINVVHEDVIDNTTSHQNEKINQLTLGD